MIKVTQVNVGKRSFVAETDEGKLLIILKEVGEPCQVIPEESLDFPTDLSGFKSARDFVEQDLGQEWSEDFLDFEIPPCAVSHLRHYCSIAATKAGES